MTDAQFNMLIERMDRLVKLMERLVELNEKPEPPADLATRYGGMSLMQRAIFADTQPVKAIGTPIEPPKVNS